jgi:MYXO-CTERM domain-containing protein
MQMTWKSKGALGGAFVVLGLLVAMPAGAKQDGRFGMSGKAGTTCTQCHIGTNDPPTVSIDGLGTPLDEGVSRTVTVTVSSNKADNSGRYAGFNAAISDGAGVLATNGDGAVRASSTGEIEVTHMTRQSFGNGPVSFSFDITAPTAGTWTFWVTGNDADGDTALFSDDVPASATMEFTVSGSGGVDGGMGEEDAGTPMEDAGAAPDDAGPEPQDAGPAPVDAGSAPDDAGNAEIDAGAGNGGENGGDTGGDNGGDGSGDDGDEDDAPGCGSRTVRTDVPWPALAAGLFLAGLLFRRRRR